MKSIVVTFSGLAATCLMLAGATPTSIRFGDEINLDNSAYGYMSKVGLPLAIKIREAEAQSGNFSVAKRRTQNKVFKIVDGYTAQLGDLPYQAGLLVDFSRGWPSVCGGSLLTANRVLTAAHCWWDGKDRASNLVVVLGSVRLYSGGIRLQTSMVNMHSEWNPAWGFRNDIAMVYLPINVQFSNMIQPIDLPPAHLLQQSFVGQIAVASGFGRTSNYASIDHRSSLSYVDLQVIPNEQCRRINQHFVPSIICTWGPRYNNICFGDSGGPLAMMTENNRFLIGVASFGSDGGCENGLPVGFTRVSAFYNWILQRL